MTSRETIYVQGDDKPYWWVTIGFDEKTRFVVNNGNKDSDWLLFVPETEFARLKAALFHAGGSVDADGSDDDQLVALFKSVFTGRSVNPFKEIEAFFENNHIPFESTAWIGG